MKLPSTAGASHLQWPILAGPQAGAWLVVIPTDPAPGYADRAGMSPVTAAGRPMAAAGQSIASATMR